MDRRKIAVCILPILGFSVGDKYLYTQDNISIHDRKYDYWILCNNNVMGIYAADFNKHFTWIQDYRNQKIDQIIYG